MDWYCIDVHRAPETQGQCDDSRWRKYRQFDGRTIPYADEEFDVALLCDVLHHAPEDAARLLAEAGRVARHVLVKDDFSTTWAPSAGRPRSLRSRARASCGSRSSSGSSSRRSTRASTRCCEPVPGALLRPDSQFIAVLRTG